MGEWTLLSPAMLGFALAAAIPVALYWWQRPRRLELPWAAMLFLERALAAEGQRRSWLQWFLIMLRVLALLFLAAAWSEPHWRGGSHAAGPATWHFIVIDSSLSMTAEDAAGVSAFARAQTAARELVQNQGPRDVFSLLVIGNKPDWIIAQPLIEPNRLRGEIDRLRCGEGKADFSQGVNDVLEMVARFRSTVGTNAIKVHVFSDGQATTWDQATIAEVSRQVNATGEITWQLHSVGETLDFNTGVTALSCETPWVVTGRPVRLAASLTHDGPTERAVTIRWTVDGQPAGVVNQTLQPGTNPPVVREQTFTSPGEHLVTLEIDTDRFAADNVRHLVVSVRDQVQMLAIGGRRAETQPFALAIKTHAQGTVNVEEVVDTAAFQKSLAPYDLIFLANIAGLSASEEQRLLAYVTAGGGVLTCCGDLTNGERFDQSSDLWPAKLLPPETLATPLLFDPLEYRHVTVRGFRNFERSGLLTTPTWRRWKLQPRADAVTCLAFSDGSPAILSREVGQGRVLMSALPFSGLSRVTLADGSETPWSAFDTWPSFVPLVNELAKYAARGSRNVRDVEVGMPLRGEWLGNLAELPQVVSPNGSTEVATVVSSDGRAEWRFAATDLVGIYQVALSAAAPPQPFVVHPPRGEVVFDRVAPDEIVRTWKNRTDASRLTTNTAAIPAWAGPLLIIALACLVLELCVAFQLGREAT